MTLASHSSCCFGCAACIQTAACFFPRLAKEPDRQARHLLPEQRPNGVRTNDRIKEFRGVSLLSPNLVRRALSAGCLFPAFPDGRRVRQSDFLRILTRQTSARRQVGLRQRNSQGKSPRLDLLKWKRGSIFTLSTYLLSLIDLFRRQNASASGGLTASL